MQQALTQEYSQFNLIHHRSNGLVLACLEGSLMTLEVLFY